MAHLNQWFFIGILNNSREF